MSVSEVDANGSNLRIIPTAGALFGFAVGSPDGLQIVGRDDDMKPYFVPRSGGGLTRVPGVDYVAYFSWSRVPKTAMSISSTAGGWQPARALADDVDFYAAESAIVVMPDHGAAGTLEQALAVGPDGRVYHRALQFSSGPGGTAWTPFMPVPGLNGSGQGIRAKKVAIAGARDGSAQIVIVGDDDLLYHAMRFPDGRWTNGLWNGFGRLDGYGSGGSGFSARDVAIAVTASTPTSPGSAHVVASHLTVGGLYHRIRSSDGNWTWFGKVPGAEGRDTQEVAIDVADNGDAYTLVTQRDGNGGSQVLRQIRWNDSSWGSFVAVGSVPTNVKDVALALSASRWV
jgi:hypothetical protein